MINRKKTWGARGISAPLATTKSKKPVASVKRVAGIPILSTFFAKRKVAAREKGIKEVGDKIEKLVLSEQQKVENAIRSAEETNNHKLIVRARSLRDQLEAAACTETDFEEGPDEGTEPHAPTMTKAQKRAISIECVAAANTANGVNWKNGTGHGGDPKYDAWKSTFDDCFTKRANG